MKRLRYKAWFEDNRGFWDDDKIIVLANNINSGFRKALKLALSDMPDSWVLLKLEFVEEMY